MKKSTPNLVIALILIAIPFGYAAYIYPSLPETIPTHFNYKGEADGFGGRDSIFLGPGILGAVSLFTFFLLTNIKNFDPKRVKEDDGMFKKFALLMVAFLSLLSLIITISANSPSINVTKLILPAIGLFLAFIGWMMPKLHQNYFAGFKLPWTLENVDNWNETHKVAGKWWLYGGIFQAISAFILEGKWAFICFMTATIIMVIVPTIFSYRMYKRGNTIQ
ncbi:MAG: SdpI family protein [Sediminibacterium sp.]